MRWILAWVAVICLAACETTDLPEPAEKSLGQFRLGHNIAIADTAERSQLASAVSNTMLEAAAQRAVANRLRVYDGDGLYHLGIVIRSLSLVQPGVPAVYAAQPTLVVEVTAFDNDTGARLNPVPERIAVGGQFESQLPFFGSGNIRPVEEQLTRLLDNMARELELWLQQNVVWFTPRPDQVRVGYDFRVPAPDIAALAGVAATAPDAAGN